MPRRRRGYGAFASPSLYRAESPEMTTTGHFPRSEPIEAQENTNAPIELVRNRDPPLAPAVSVGGQAAGRSSPGQGLTRRKEIAQKAVRAWGTDAESEADKATPLW